MQEKENFPFFSEGGGGCYCSIKHPKRFTTDFIMTSENAWLMYAFQTLKI